MSVPKRLPRFVTILGTDGGMYGLLLGNKLVDRLGNGLETEWIKDGFDQLRQYAIDKRV